MEQQIVIKYDVLKRTVCIVENDFSTFESFGILEAAKQMIANGWLEGGEEQE